MPLSIKQNRYAPMLDSLSEPAFLFSPAGKYWCANAVGRSLLRSLGYGSDPPFSNNGFLQHLSRFENQQAAGQFLIDDSL